MSNGAAPRKTTQRLPPENQKENSRVARQPSFGAHSYERNQSPKEAPVPRDHRSLPVAKTRKQPNGPDGRREMELRCPPQQTGARDCQCRRLRGRANLMFSERHAGGIPPASWKLQLNPRPLSKSQSTQKLVKQTREPSITGFSRAQSAHGFTHLRSLKEDGRAGSPTDRVPALATRVVLPAWRRPPSCPVCKTVLFTPGRCSFPEDWKLPLCAQRPANPHISATVAL